MWFRYKCYLNGVYKFQGIIEASDISKVKKKAKSVWCDKYEIKDIEEVV